MAIDFTESYPIVQWDLNNRTLFKHYFGSVDDSANGYKLQIVQDTDILIPTTEEVYFYFEKKDNTHGYIKAEIIDDYFVIHLTNQVFAVKGKVSCNFQITSNNKWKTSPEFKIDVDENNIKDSIESSDDFIVFQEALNNLGDLTIEVNEATTNANVATTNAINAANNANTKATLADEKATLANNAATLANEKAILANEKAGLANTATTNANTATNNANIATTNANNAANLANEKAGLANMAATNANVVATQLSNETLKIYKGAVVSYSDLAITYPNPENGWTVTVSSETTSYRYNGTEWINLGVISSVGTATDATLGIVKGGGDVHIAIDGSISVPNKLEKTGDSKDNIITFEDYTTTTPIPSAEAALSEISSGKKHNSLWSNIKAFCNGVITVGKLANNLITTNEGLALDARQGKVLGDQVDTLNKNIDNSNKFSANGIAVDSGYTAAAECLLQVAISTTTAQYSGAEFAINDITRGAFGVISANMGASQTFTVRLQHGDKLTYVINAAGGSVTAKVFPKS